MERRACTLSLGCSGNTVHEDHGEYHILFNVVTTSCSEQDVVHILFMNRMWSRDSNSKTLMLFFS